MRSIVAIVILTLTLNAVLVEANEVNISPMGISVISGAFNTSPPSALGAAIDRSGLLLTDFETDDLATVAHNPADENEARLFNGSAATIRLDLGTDYTLTTAYLWNCDSMANNNIGTYEYTFRDSSLNIVGTTETLDATDVYYLEQLPPDTYNFDAPLSSVRFVDLNFTRREGSSLGVFGVGEVAFKAIPEPASATLIGIFAGSIFFVRRRFAV